MHNSNNPNKYLLHLNIASQQEPTALDEHHARIRESRKNATVGQEKYRKQR
jgi:hypothetical protein